MTDGFPLGPSITSLILGSEVLKVTSVNYL